MTAPPCRAPRLVFTVTNADGTGSTASTSETEIEPVGAETSKATYIFFPLSPGTRRWRFDRPDQDFGSHPHRTRIRGNHIGSPATLGPVVGDLNSHVGDADNSRACEAVTVGVQRRPVHRLITCAACPGGVSATVPEAGPGGLQALRRGRAGGRLDSASPGG